MHHRSHDRGSCLRGVCIRAGLGRPPPPSITRYGQQAGGMHPTGMHSGYRPQTKFVQVMFLHVSVILSTEGEYLGRYPLAGTSLPCRYTPPLAGNPTDRYTPRPQCMLGYGQQAGGTHPTGMHSCFIYFFVCCLEN